MANPKKPNWADLEDSAFIDQSMLNQLFAEYMKKVLHFDDESVALFASDLEKLYGVPYLTQDYLEVIDRNGVKYEVRYCRANFSVCGFCSPRTKAFKFYVLFDKSTMPDNTVGSYIDARKLFYV
jgi:hypothetical protein